MGLETKQLLFDGAALSDTGTISGYASVWDGIDAYGDTIVRGAYANTIPKFLADGFIGWSHDERTPVAYPTAAREDDHGLWIEAAFHSTPAAQEARQIALERLAAGKRMGFSIGYYTKRAEMTDSGVRRLLDLDLVETSLVMVPADDAARVAAVKSAEPPAVPAEPCACLTGHGLEYDAHAEHLTHGVTEFLARTKQGAELRVKEGRAISSARRERMATVSGSLRQAADEIDAMLTETAPPEKAAEPVGFDPRLALALRAARLRRHGIALEGATLPCP